MEINELPIGKPKVSSTNFFGRVMAKIKFNMLDEEMFGILLSNTR